MPSADKSLDILISHLTRYKSKRILLVGERLDFLFDHLTFLGFKITALPVEGKIDEDIYSLTNKTFDDSFLPWPIDFILASDGGQVANFAKLISLQAFYRNDVKDFFKKVVVPFNALPFGIFLSSSCDGNEIEKTADYKDSKHHFLYRFSSPFLFPSFVIPSTNHLSSPSDKVSLFLKTGKNEVFSDISLNEAYLLSQQPSNNQMLDKIKGLSRIVLGKLPSSSLPEAVLSVLPFVKDFNEKEELSNFLKTSKISSLQFDDVLKTKLKEKA